MGIFNDTNLTDEQKKQLEWFNSIMAQMEKDEKDRIEREKQEYINSFLPDEKEFDYKEYNGPNDGSLIEKAKNENQDFYEHEKDKIDYEYNEAISEVNKNSEELNENAKQDSEDSLKEFSEGVEKFKSNAMKNNIYDSSIVGSKTRELRDITEKELLDIKNQLDSELKNIEDKKAQVEKEKEFDLKDLSSEYDKKVQNTFDDLKREQKEIKDEIDKYNKEVKKEEKEYNENYNKILNEKSEEYDNMLEKMYDDEAKNGYTGDRAEEYQERLDMATEFFKRYPKDVALKMIDSNPNLSKFLGMHYYGLLEEIKNA